MITFSELFEKFETKGYVFEFITFVPHPPIINLHATFLYMTTEEKVKSHNKIVQRLYGSQWDYWNTWIDHQQHKF